MRKIGIVTDSVANLLPEVAAEKKIKVIPLKITLGSKTYLDGVDLTAGEFYHLLEKSEEIPGVSPPNSGKFLEMFETLREEGYESAICILSSTNISPAYNAACEARDMVRPFPVMVIDSHAATMSQGFMVLEAIKGADEGLTITEVVEKVWNLRSRVHFYGLVGMLHYLVRFKRLGKVSAYFRALFNIKPIITIDSEDGTIQSVARVKSRQQGLNYFLKKIEEELSLGGEQLHVAVVHADEAQEAEKLYEMISQKFKCEELYLQELTPAIGCHIGPGVIGVNFFVS
jgi:DegV family protein with EDD domain